MLEHRRAYQVLPWATCDRFVTVWSTYFAWPGRPMDIWTTFFDNERVELVAFGGWFLTALNITARSWWISIHCTGPFMWRPKYRWEEPAARNVTMKNEKTHWPASQPAFGSHSIWFQYLRYCIPGFHGELLLCWYWVDVCCCQEGVWHFQLTLWWIFGFMLVDENPEKSVCKRQH